jgi:HEAT repeat protein
MHEVKRTGLSLGLGLALLILTGFESKEHPSQQGANRPDEVSRHVAQLRSGKPQQKAAAAYWLGQQRTVSASAVEALVQLLGDTSEIDPLQYRALGPEPRFTLGGEAAAALVNIGHAAVEPLIRVLKTSPQPEARKNAAWALGLLHRAASQDTSDRIWAPSVRIISRS